MTHWNNTGVYQNFACSSQPVLVPEQFTPVEEKGNWKVFYTVHSKLTIFTYSDDGVGLLMVAAIPPAREKMMLEKLIADNAKLNLKKQFNLPNTGVVSYNLHSQKNKWVITKVNGKKVDRKFDKWQRLNIQQ